MNKKQNRIKPAILRGCSEVYLTNNFFYKSKKKKLMELIFL